MSEPVCRVCNDTHQMILHGDMEDHARDQVVMCTHCPTPCQRCRQGGNGPYCTDTPCSCSCHKGNSFEMAASEGHGEGPRVMHHGECIAHASTREWAKKITTALRSYYGDDT